MSSSVKMSDTHNRVSKKKALANVDERSSLSVCLSLDRSQCVHC